MRISAITTFVSLLSLPLFAQQSGQDTGRRAVLYSGFANPVEGVTASCPCRNIRFSTDNGRIIYYDQVPSMDRPKQPCGKAIVKPDTVGKAAVRIWCKGLRDSVLLATMNYTVRQLPLNVPHVSGYRGGEVWASHFRMSRAVEGFFFNCFDWPDWRYPVLGYMFKCVRKDGATSVIRNEGAFFSDDILRIVQTVMPGDMVIISDVRCRYPDKSIQVLPAIVFTMK